MSRDHIILPHDRDINSDGVAELAADICQMVRVRDVLIAEAIMAAYLATIHLTRNCGCTSGSRSRAADSVSPHIGQ